MWTKWLWGKQDPAIHLAGFDPAVRFAGVIEADRKRALAWDDMHL